MCTLEDPYTPHRGKSHMCIYLWAPTVEEAFHLRVVPVCDELRGGVQRPQDLDADAVGEVLRKAGLGTNKRLYTHTTHRSKVVKRKIKVPEEKARFYINQQHRGVPLAAAACATEQDREEQEKRCRSIRRGTHGIG